MSNLIISALIRRDEETQKVCEDRDGREAFAGPGRPRIAGGHQKLGASGRNHPCQHLVWTLSSKTLRGDFGGLKPARLR